MSPPPLSESTPPPRSRLPFSVPATTTLPALSVPTPAFSRCPSALLHTWFFVHFMALHTPLAQSVPITQSSPSAQAGQPDTGPPPQSLSVSRPPFRLSVHVD